MALSKPQPLANSFFFEADIYDDLDSTAFKTSLYVFHTKTYAYTVTSVARSQSWHRFAVLGNPDGSMVFSIDGRTVGTITGQFADANQVQVEGYNGGTTTYDVDDLRIRRWTGPEPAPSPGAEEFR